MTTRTATLRLPIACPEGCGRELTVVELFDAGGAKFLECCCTDPPKRYQLPTIELEVIEPWPIGSG